MSKITLDTTVSVSIDTLSRDVNGEEVILDFTSGVYFGLEGAGAFIWKQLKSEILVKQIHSKLLENFEVPAKEAEVDLIELLHTLLSKNLIQIIP